MNMHQIFKETEKSHGKILKPLWKVLERLWNLDPQKYTNPVLETKTNIVNCHITNFGHSMIIFSQPQCTTQKSIGSVTFDIRATIKNNVYFSSICANI